MEIKSEKEVEEELGGKDGKEKAMRYKLENLGDQLVDTTVHCIKAIKKFMNQFNKLFEQVRLINFVFEEADYCLVAEKEVSEVRDIFRAFEIEVRPLPSFRKL